MAGKVAEIGFCIYCGSKEPPLTREHVLPRGLAGNEAPVGSSEAIVLRKATCEMCREITRKIEEDCLLDMLGPARKRLGLTRKDRRSPTSPILVTGSDRKSETVLHLVDQHLLGGMILPAFRTAQCFSNATEKDRGVDFKMIIVEPAVFPDGATRVGVQLKANKDTFARMLAKIALGIAIAKMGKDSFIPVVHDIILGRETDVHRHVGGFCEEIPSPPTDRGFHWMHIRKHDGMLIVDIQLFAQYGGPVNYVVVGYLTENYVTSKHIRPTHARRL